METGTTIQLRNAVPEDAAALVALCSQLGYTTTVSDVRRRLARGPGEPDGTIAVACDGDRVAGWIEVCVARALVIGAWAEITGLVVDQDSRRRGVGRRMVQWAREWAREHQQTRLRVRSNAIRHEAPAFYEAQGFVQTKRQRVFEMTP
jgi:GNAT superfamily N-acetyltransferase